MSLKAGEGGQGGGEGLSGREWGGCRGFAGESGRKGRFSEGVCVQVTMAPWGGAVLRLGLCSVLVQSGLAPSAPVSAPASTS
jgi:hypothetical protein